MRAKHLFLLLVVPLFLSCKGGASENTATEKSGAAASFPRDCPDTYTVKLETTKGDILIDVFEDWAPKAAARFRDIVASGYYDGVAFHRVLEAYLAQAGVNGDPEKNAAWQNRPLEKDPLRQNNKCGTVTFAKEGPNGLSTQFFINLKDNHQFDDQGLPPFGKVRHLQVTDNLDYSHSHGIRPDPVRIMKEGVSYLKRDYPKMDYINKATIITAPNPSPKTPAKDPGSPTDVPPSRKGDSQAQ